MQHRLHIRPARKQTTPLSRNRVLYAMLMLAVVAYSLLWRSGFIPMAQWLSNNGGDCAPLDGDTGAVSGVRFICDGPELHAVADEPGVSVSSGGSRAGDGG